MANEYLRPGKVMSDYCKCGHKKDFHCRDKNGHLQCQVNVYNKKAHKMMQCGCKI